MDGGKTTFRINDNILLYRYWIWLAYFNLSILGIIEFSLTTIIGIYYYSNWNNNRKM